MAQQDKEFADSLSADKAKQERELREEQQHGTQLLQNLHMNLVRQLARDQVKDEKERKENSERETEKRGVTEKRRRWALSSLSF